MPETSKKRIAKPSSAKPARAKKTAVKALASKDTDPAETRKESARARDVIASAHAPAPELKMEMDQDGIAAAEEMADVGGSPPMHTAGRDRYFEAVGRRKTAIARVRLYTRSGAFIVNEKAYGEYFPTLDLQKIAEDALKKMKLWERFRISARVSGGGIHAQAEAVRHGLARCLISFNPDFRKRMKRAGFLKRDPRMKERKKFGLKKARKAPQWAKR